MRGSRNTAGRAVMGTYSEDFRGPAENGHDGTCKTCIISLYLYIACILYPAEVSVGERTTRANVVPQFPSFVLKQLYTLKQLQVLQK